MEHIRKFQSGDVEESMRLSSFSFQYTLTNEEWEAKKGKFQTDQWYAYIVDERLAAQLRIIPLEIWLQGRKWRMGGIASVATWPEYRRQGCVRKLMTHALQEMKEQKQTVSMLHPFSFAFYKNFGWSSFVDYERWSMDMEQIPQFAPEERPCGSYERISDWTTSPKALGVLHETYQQYAKQFSGTLGRTIDWWEDSITRRKRGTAVFYRNVHGTATGYLLYTVKEFKLNILEWAAVDDEAERALWLWIRQHDSMAGKVQLTVPAKTDMLYHFSDRNFNRQHISYFMGRIVDVRSFLQQYQFRPKAESYRLILTVQDSYAEWNEGTWQVDVAASGHVQLVEQVQLDHAQDDRSEHVKCDISELSAVMLGSMRPLDMWRKGGFVSSEKSANLWEDVVPRLTPHFPDYF